MHIEQLLRKEKALEKQHEERNELRAAMEDRGREFVHLSHSKAELEADLAQSHEKLHSSHLEVQLTLTKTPGCAVYRNYSLFLMLFFWMFRSEAEIS